VAKTQTVEMTTVAWAILRLDDTVADTAPQNMEMHRPPVNLALQVGQGR
jgi:hypothetical protein